ncbi:MAG: helix-turn-helix domain-containing protein [Solirubrobacterales bacterium]
MSLAERFAANLKRCRRRAGINKSQLARLTELSPTAISRFESGKRMPRLDTLVKLSGALDCRADELVEGLSWKPDTADAYGSFEVTDA